MKASGSMYHRLADVHKKINESGQILPSIYTPRNPLSKASALTILFSKFCQNNGYVAPLPPLPQVRKLVFLHILIFYIILYRSRYCLSYFYHYTAQSSRHILKLNFDIHTLEFVYTLTGALFICSTLSFSILTNPTLCYRSSRILKKKSSITDFSIVPIPKNPSYSAKILNYQPHMAWTKLGRYSISLLYCK